MFSLGDFLMWNGNLPHRKQWQQDSVTSLQSDDFISCCKWNVCHAKANATLCYVLAMKDIGKKIWWEKTAIEQPTWNLDL